jgi:hypothetical protein
MGESLVSAKTSLWAAAAILLSSGLHVSAQTFPSPTYNNVTINGTISGGSVTATGGTTPRTLASRASDVINVKDYGAACDSITDDRNAFNSAITRVNTINAAGGQAVIYVPAGKCLVKGTNGALTRFVRNGGVVGDGPNMSWVTMDSTYTGDLFSWSESWMSSQYGGNTVDVANQKAGPLVKDLTIVGNRSAGAPQYALRFYDRDDQILVRNVNIYFVKGSCVSTGTLSATTQAFIRESRFENVRCYNSGDTGIPAWDFSADGSGTGGTPVEVVGVNIYAPYGTGMAIRSNAVGLRDYKFSQLRIEGLEGDPAISADLLVIGDPTYVGSVDGLKFNEVQLISPYINQCALRFTASSAALRPFNITMQQSHISVGGNSGKGLCIDALRSSNLQFTGISTTGTNVTVGSSAMVGGDITIDGNGGEGTWTWSVDSTSERSIKGYVYRTGYPQSTQQSITATYHDNTVAGGNAVGSGSIDLQSSRLGAGQVASGAGTVILGGSQNTAAGPFSVIAGGFNNTLSADYSVSPGGRQASDNGRKGMFVYSGGAEIAAQGDTQLGMMVLKATATSTTAVRLTTDATSPSTTNCYNIPNNKAATFSIYLHARNFSVAGTDYSWTMPNAMLTRDANAASTALATGTAVTLTRGTVTGAAVSATADTTNGCLNLSFTPPSGNASTWHVNAVIVASEVQ